MSVTTQAHTLQEYLNQATPVLMEIPGLPELLHADGDNYDRFAEKYPDAVFTLIAMNNLFHHDRKFSEIHQEAVPSILDGEDIFGTTAVWTLTCKRICGMTNLWNKSQ